MRPVDDIVKSYMWGSGLLRITLVCPLYQDSVLRAACYGQNALLQPYDLPVTRGGQICKTLQSETMGEEGFEPSKA